MAAPGGTRCGPADKLIQICRDCGENAQHLRAVEQYPFLANLGDGAKVSTTRCSRSNPVSPPTQRRRTAISVLRRTCGDAFPARSREVVCGQLPYAETVKPVGNVLRLVIVKELVDTTGTQSCGLGNLPDGKTCLVGGDDCPDTLPVCIVQSDGR